MVQEPDVDARIQLSCSAPAADAASGTPRCGTARPQPQDVDPGGTPEPAIDPMAHRVRALEALLTQKGYVDPDALDLLVEAHRTRIGPRNGARVVARAWVDAGYREWLLKDATAAIASLGYQGRQGEHMVAVECTADMHHLVVCTLRGGYPWPVLGLPPAWYRGAAYRARAVREPRAVLSEFGVTLPATTRIRVWDSTAEIRYLVIPRRPAGTDGLAEGELAALVTRDSMIGTGLARGPAAGK